MTSDERDRRQRFAVQLKTICMLVHQLSNESWCDCGFAAATEAGRLAPEDGGPSACTCTWMQVDQVLNDLAYLHLCVTPELRSATPYDRGERDEAANRIARVIMELRS